VAILLNSSQHRYEKEETIKDLQGAVDAGLPPNIHDPPLLGAIRNIGMLSGNLCGGLGDCADPNIWRNKAERREARSKKTYCLWPPPH
jgi:hypothetical protein